MVAPKLAFPHLTDRPKSTNSICGPAAFPSKNKCYVEAWKEVQSKYPKSVEETCSRNEKLKKFLPLEGSLLKISGFLHSAEKYFNEIACPKQSEKRKYYLELTGYYNGVPGISGDSRWEIKEFGADKSIWMLIILNFMKVSMSIHI